MIGLSRLEVGPLEFALVLFLNASKGVEAVKGAKEAFGCGVGVTEGTSGVNGEGGLGGGRALRAEKRELCARALPGGGSFP